MTAALQTLVLDSAIRDWVLLPITLVMILVGILRHNVTLLIDSPPKKISKQALREQRVLARAQALRINFFQLPPSAFAARKAFLTDALGSGAYLQKANEGEENGSAAPASPFDPSQMDGMMQQMMKSMVMMVPQTVIMGWINFFFSGFVLIKLPFPLTLRFKLMLQRGVDTADMDVSWVSSISWYFLCLFGLNAIYRLVLGDGNAADSTRDMAMMPGAAATGPSQPDWTKLHAAEKDNLELVGLPDSTANSAGSATTRKQLDGADGRRWIGDGVASRVLKMYA
ncbi:unnamed protein product [Tilletia controversa]|uniref:ER membrane protein complex subunit 3 n=3 Tax=Tilletia TaxID=13289 RepID=A0A8X7MKT9_9BASI|nr:hypothetical protein CF336_g7521 [Tilletia laevis]KAE8186246.1 hypothetical protein CF328_g7290 [Tilletia controversa]KAE8248006.1 hypothetical protein A4X03_0g6898 [Tilletia caries]KAE8187645.1 hypothetical protein CF335_g7112 [Tilletia laevis]KAE8239602.1 hypothetical protein A4X06_0g8178 [Tilletia controversa]